MEIVFVDSITHFKRFLNSFIVFSMCLISEKLSHLSIPAKSNCPNVVVCVAGCRAPSQVAAEVKEKQYKYNFL